MVSCIIRRLAAFLILSTLLVAGLPSAQPLAAANSRIAVPAASLTSTTVIQVSAGLTDTCAVTSAHALRCWGGLYYTDRKIVPSDIGPVSQVNADYDYTCAITSANALRCWGDINYPHQPVPSDLGAVSQVSAVGNHTCAITSAHALRCWGENGYGQSTVPSDLGAVSQVSAGYSYTCAVTSGGGLRCWGENSSGQSTVPSGLGTVSQVSAGGNHTCAVTSGGGLRCWGENGYGQATVPSDLGTVSQVSAGGNHTCAITSASTLRCWGHDRFSQATVPDDLLGAPAYSITGRITDSSNLPLAGIDVSDGTHSTTTTSTGDYSLNNVSAGSHTLIPTKSNYRFTPATLSVTVSSGDLSGQDFVGTTAEHGLVDVSISLYSNPTDAQRIAYEEIVRYFADGVFEESNGAHKLRTVTIYPNQGLSGRANIQWIANCWPNARISGYGTPGLRVEMCDSFSGVDFLTDYEAGGYVLAHEWGHYYYSLYDEYGNGQAACQSGRPNMPCINDSPVPNSIMDDQWQARGGNYTWLNFSTPINNTRNTAQQRVYRASGWETLTRTPALDPRDGVLTNNPTRLYYPELASVAPAAGQAPRIDLGVNNTARSALQIVWGSSTAALAASQPEVTASISALDGGAISYPNPIRVLAVLQRTQPIAGALAQGEIVAPDGSSQAITLRDDGVAPDTRANDGLYSALLAYQQDGLHTIRVRFTNSDGTAREVADSGALAPPLPGTTPQLPTPPSITDPFDVLTELTVDVTGFQVDDHGDTWATATTLALTNTDSAGQIDRAGDHDFFRITTTSGGALVVRITSLAFGMQPQVRLLASDGSTELARSDLSTSASADYLLLRYTVAAGETLYIDVAHHDPTAVQGFYHISAGTLLSNEVAGGGTVYLPLIVR